MLKTINVFFYAFLTLTSFIVVIHFKKIDYYEYPSKGIIENLYTGLTKISTHISKEDSLDYTLSISFNHIKTSIFIHKIEINAEEVNSQETNVLRINKILPYSGMHNWDIPEFSKFSDIPENLRSLNVANNPYFAYDYILSSPAHIELKKIKIRVKISFTENSILKNLDKELIILKKSKIGFKPLDNHSDGTLFLIPSLMIITTILWAYKVKYKRSKNRNEQE